VPECELLTECGFFRKYQSTKNLACQGFITSYCRGPSMEQCVRRGYQERHGSLPSDDMMPTGHMLKDGLFRSAH
jgi:hypothetical protein